MSMLPLTWDHSSLTTSEKRSHLDPDDMYSTFFFYLISLGKKSIIHKIISLFTHARDQFSNHGCYSPIKVCYVSCFFLLIPRLK